ncbi:Arylphorin subunit alpha [Eumeta japonica]|uniref:Arylphorin subunit alpha n=1 Tax=Eumeta variegata TaxID=151549 RepID=A0A4C1V028_EUMVA|nr:Arylphorin subunit alpha [Eumeta japonica]
MSLRQLKLYDPKTPNRSDFSFGHEKPPQRLRDSRSPRMRLSCSSRSCGWSRAVCRSHDDETKPGLCRSPKKVFSLLRHIQQIDRDSEYYKIGYSTTLKLTLETTPTSKPFTRLLLGHANVNEGLFVYSFSIAIIHRQDTSGLVLPAPYEIYPYFFVNSEVIQKLYVVKMKEGKLDPKLAPFYGIHVDGNVYTVYANYSGYDTWYNSEHKLSYFTEDIGLNTYYYYFHKSLPFWMKGDEFGWLKQRRGEILLLPPTTRSPGTTLVSYLGGKPFTQRNDYYYLERPEYTEALQIIQNYESQFLEYVHEGQFKGQSETSSCLYDYFDFDATNAVYYKPEDLKQVPYAFRPALLNHKASDVKISVKSDGN